MGRFLLGVGIALGIVTWLWTTVLMFLYYGILWGLIAFFFPPADLIAMFFVGTWPLGLAAAGAWGLGVLLESKEEGA